MRCCAQCLPPHIISHRPFLFSVAPDACAAELAEEFESSYLLLSELYVERGKFDLAQDLCRCALGCNKSCAKAWEALGLIMEKEGSFADAAECYEKAWALGRRTSAPVGFKLGFNYLKAARAVDAMDVCAKVLARYPGYPKIREEVMDKAQALLRP
jgi:tetratricopeptide repeat protein 21B